MPQNVLSPSSDHEEKLGRLLAIAAEIFAEKGYHHASIRDLARRADVSLSGLYYYFSSKEELLFMIQERSLRGMLADLERALQGVDDPPERLRLVIHTHLKFRARHRAAMRVVIHDFGALEGKYRDKIQVLRSKYIELCTEILRDLRRISGTGDVAPLNVATSALLGMLTGTHAWQEPEASVPADRLAEHLYRLFAGGFTGHMPASSMERRAG